MPDFLEAFFKKVHDVHKIKILNNDGTFDKKSGFKDLAEKINDELKKIINFKSEGDREIKGKLDVDTNQDDILHEIDLRRLVANNKDPCGKKKIQLAYLWTTGELKEGKDLEKLHDDYKKWFTGTKKPPAYLNIGKVRFWDVYFIQGNEGKGYIFYKSYLRITKIFEGYFNETGTVDYLIGKEDILSGKFDIVNRHRLIKFEASDHNQRFYSFSGHYNRETREGERLINGIGLIKLATKLYSTPVILKPSNLSTVDNQSFSLNEMEPEQIEFGQTPETDILIGYLAQKRRTLMNPIRPNKESVLRHTVDKGHRNYEEDYRAVEKIFKVKQWTSFSRLLSVDQQILSFSYEFDPDPITRKIKVIHKRKGQVAYTGHIDFYDNRFLSFSLTDNSKNRYPQKIMAMILQPEPSKSITILKCLSTVLKTNFESHVEPVVAREVIISKKIEIETDDEGKVKYEDFLKLNPNVLPDKLKAVLSTHFESTLSFMEFGEHSQLLKQRIEAGKHQGKYKLRWDDCSTSKIRAKIVIDNSSRVRLVVKNEKYVGILQSSKDMSWCTLKPKYESEGQTNTLPVMIQFQSTKEGIYRGVLLLGGSSHEFTLTSRS